jgi:hypothetical protein
LLIIHMRNGTWDIAPVHDLLVSVKYFVPAGQIFVAHLFVCEIRWFGVIQFRGDCGPIPELHTYRFTAGM